MSIEFLVKLRDAAIMIHEACEAELEKTASAGAKEGRVEGDKPKPEDIDKLFWETLKGTKGPYQQTSKRATNNHVVFQQLQAYVKAKKGFVLFGDYKYWFDRNDEDVIDRRRK